MVKTAQEIDLFTRTVLLHAISEHMISYEEFALLYDINTSEKRDFEY